MTPKNIWRKLEEWNREFFDVFMDLSTVRGRWRFLGFSIISTYALWHLHDFFAWERKLLGIPYEINRGKQAWTQLWAVIIGGSGIVTALLSIFVIPPIERYRARKSAKGQWFDRSDLTKEDLYGDSPDDLPGDSPEPNPPPQQSGHDR